MAKFWQKKSKRVNNSFSTLKKAKKPSFFSRIFTRKRKAQESSISTTQTPYSAAAGQHLKNLKIKKRQSSLNRQNLKTSLKPPARLAKTKSPRLAWFLLFFLIISLTAGGVYFVFFTDYFQVSEFNLVEDDTTITNELGLNNLVTEYLQNKNILFLNSAELEKKILENAQEYGKAKVSINWPNKITINLEKSPQIANLNNIVIGEDNIRTVKKFIINSHGIIVQENQENTELPYLVISSKKAFSLGMKPLPFEHLDYILKTSNLFEEKFGIRVIEVEYLQIAREIRLRTEKGFSVWLDLNYGDSDKNMLLQIDKLKRALPKLDIYKTPLEYIDLRISGTDAEKVIYKRR